MDCTYIVLAIRNDLAGFEKTCKPCYDLRLKAETSHLMCFNHIDNSLSTVEYLSKKKEDITMIRVEHFHNSNHCMGHCFYGEGEWFFALKEEDLSSDESLKAMSERAKEIMSCGDKARANNYEEEQTSPKKQKCSP